MHTVVQSTQHAQHAACASDADWTHVQHSHRARHVHSVHSTRVQYSSPMKPRRAWRHHSTQHAPAAWTAHEVFAIQHRDRSLAIAAAGVIAIVRPVLPVIIALQTAERGTGHGSASSLGGSVGDVCARAETVVGVAGVGGGRAGRKTCGACTGRVAHACVIAGQDNSRWHTLCSRVNLYTKSFQ